MMQDIEQSFVLIKWRLLVLQFEQHAAEDSIKGMTKTKGMSFSYLIFFLILVNFEWSLSVSKPFVSR